MQQRGQINLQLALTIFLGVGMLLFGILAIVAAHDNSTTTAHTNTLKQQAAAAATATQKKADALTLVKAEEAPYQTYTADPVDGSFVLQFPKDWSIYAAKDPGGTTSLQLYADPNAVVDNLASGAINTHQFQLTLTSESVADENKSFETALKKGTLTSRPVTVSGIQGTWFQGTLDSEGHQGVIVTLQVRNQTMLITTQTTDYLSEFNTILSTAVIHP